MSKGGGCNNMCIVWCLVVLLGMTACAARTVQMSVAQVESLSAAHGCSVRIVHGARFPLLTVTTDTIALVHAAVLRVYIEGDGLAWRTRRHLSAHPTPVNPLALRLMLVDPSMDKLYIARPCQFVQSANCDPRLWSSARYCDEVIAAVSQVLDQLKQEKNYTRVELVGYSGGATVALLLAARRSDVVSVRTVSGNLDPDAFCRLHHVSPLTGSLNPVNYADSLQKIPQLHFIGADDSIITMDIFSSYRRYFPNQDVIKAQIVAGVDHHSGWVERWPELLRQPPRAH